ncbi:HNH endonuclease [Macrococcus armenti]|nr:HNH endonuclease [Macrococcus armenti]UBH09736.1 HNH endonuclease [Macrococcus armenti]UBH12040.1 HNH endonuclease [Macrococcus armenti]
MNCLAQPRFDDKYVYGKITLPKELWIASDEKQFKYATKMLQDLVKNDFNLSERFTNEQLESIIKGSERIKNLTWHHSDKPGVIILVDRKIHQLTGHTGGNVFWGENIR